MSVIHMFFYISMMVWFLTEFFYKKRLKSGDRDQNKDSSTLGILWIAIIFSIASSVTISYFIDVPIVHAPWIMYIGELFIVMGIVFRFIIIKSLGKYFTVDIAIKDDHAIKKEGFYRYLRHPSYAFSLLTSLGLGLYLNNWISLALAFLIPFLAFNYRIMIEEKALIERFGEEYIEYSKNTKKLLPFIY
ncbi:isoprenylcysteine carboxylmethyltransferase family protein [Chryseobacterium nematophagum]|uniref:Isoprenylcysteine carboxylmethyltransferase family protein n=1 Tax=Chryseobacterium nematophagum TaxID=2305228 RepID=A0A3M7LFE3_9FLAO|nr:isoprenylcysteine carboxylmethyltransferase family protein [Chryseobacterium nematophagum]RMZ60815.1 isoprenylcysteine carboxylmethyltransferase family protein [Chryseobacterium nematophagum]